MEENTKLTKRSPQDLIDDDVTCTKRIKVKDDCENPSRNSVNQSEDLLFCDERLVEITTTLSPVVNENKCERNSEEINNNDRSNGIFGGIINDRSSEKNNDHDKEPQINKLKAEIDNEISENGNNGDCKGDEILLLCDEEMPTFEFDEKCERVENNKKMMPPAESLVCSKLRDIPESKPLLYSKISEPQHKRVLVSSITSTEHAINPLQRSTNDRSMVAPTRQNCGSYQAVEEVCNVPSKENSTIISAIDAPASDNNRTIPATEIVNNKKNPNLKDNLFEERCNDNECEQSIDNTENFALINDTQPMAYSWDELQLGTFLGTASLNEHLRKELYQNQDIHTVPQLNAQETLELVKNLRLETVLPPRNSKLHRVVQRSHHVINHQNNIYCSSSSIDLDRQHNIDPNQEFVENDDGGPSVPYESLARLYEAMCAQDAHDSDNYSREAQYLSATSCIQRLATMENQISDLRRREIQVLQTGRRLGLNIMPHHVGELLGFAKEDKDNKVAR